MPSANKRSTSSRKSKKKKSSSKKSGRATVNQEVRVNVRPGLSGGGFFGGGGGGHSTTVVLQPPYMAAGPSFNGASPREVNTMAEILAALKTLKSERDATQMMAPVAPPFVPQMAQDFGSQILNAGGFSGGGGGGGGGGAVAGMMGPWMDYQGLNPMNWTPAAAPGASSSSGLRETEGPLRPEPTLNSIATSTSTTAAPPEFKDKKKPKAPKAVPMQVDASSPKMPSAPPLLSTSSSVSLSSPGGSVSAGAPSSSAIKLLPPPPSLTPGGSAASASASASSLTQYVASLAENARADVAHSNERHAALQVQDVGMRDARKRDNAEVGSLLPPVVEGHRHGYHIDATRRLDELGHHQPVRSSAKNVDQNQIVISGYRPPTFHAGGHY